MISTYLLIALRIKRVREYENAEIYLKKSINLNPNLAISYVNLATVQKDLKKLSKLKKHS